MLASEQGRSVWVQNSQVRVSCESWWKRGKGRFGSCHVWIWIIGMDYICPVGMKYFIMGCSLYGSLMRVSLSM